MPKIKLKQDIEEEEDIEDEMEDEVEDEIDEDELETEEYPKAKKKVVKEKVKPEVKRRFGIVPPQPLRYIDTETNEVIAEADINDSKSMQIAILAAISDLKEQIERIEVQIGAITG